MMRGFLFTFLLFGITVSVQAQQKERVSGYLGNRFVLGVGTEVSLSRHPQRSYKAAYEDGVTLNKTFLTYVDYAIKRNKTIGFRAGITRTSAGLVEDNFLKYDHSHGGFDFTVGSVQGSPAIRDFSYGITYKIFKERKGAMAPVGPYFSIGVNRHDYKVDYSNVSYVMYDFAYNTGNESLIIKSDNPIHKFSFYELFFEMGKAKPVRDKLVLDYSMKIGMIHSFEEEEYEPSNLEFSANNAVIDRLRGLCYVNFSLKFGFLL